MDISNIRKNPELYKENQAKRFADPLCEALDLGDRMKAYEGQHNNNVLPYLHFIVRLDGKNFSKFTNGFMKPFDNLFVVAMVNTMNDLVTKFNPRTGYTHSDEITLIFSASCTKEEYDNKTNKSVHMLNGRVMKLCSILASYCSARFNYHIHHIMNNTLKKESHYNYTDRFVTKVCSHEACFDARILEIPYDKPYEVVNHMIWRSVKDCHRNTVSAYGHHYLTKSQMHKKHSDNIIEMLKDEVIMKNKTIDWATDVPIYLKYGVYCKKELHEKETDVNGIKTVTIRQRIKNVSFKISYSDRMLEFLLDKNFLNDEFTDDCYSFDIADGGVITVIKNEKETFVE